jgi:hypothetical protein
MRVKIGAMVIAPARPTRLLGKTYIHLFLIALLGLPAYSNTFEAPFQWDDKSLIEENPIVKDLSYFLEPSKHALG